MYSSHQSLTCATQRGNRKCDTTRFRALLVLTGRPRGKTTIFQTGTHIVGGPPRLEFEVPLETWSKILLKVFGQALHSLVLLIFHQRAHRLQVLSTQNHPELHGVTQRNVYFVSYYLSIVLRRIEPGMSVYLSSGWVPTSFCLQCFSK